MAAPFVASVALAATGNPWAAAFLLVDDVAQIARALSTQDPMDAAFAAFAVVGNISAFKNAGKYLRGLRHGQRGTQAAKSSGRGSQLFNDLDEANNYIKSGNPATRNEIVGAYDDLLDGGVIDDLNPPMPILISCERPDTFTGMSSGVRYNEALQQNVWEITVARNTPSTSLHALLAEEISHSLDNQHVLTNLAFGRTGFSYRSVPALIARANLEIMVVSRLLRHGHFFNKYEMNFFRRHLMKHNEALDTLSIYMRMPDFAAGRRILSDDTIQRMGMSWGYNRPWEGGV